jgi:hypothetical protein
VTPLFEYMLTELRAAPRAKILLIAVFLLGAGASWLVADHLYRAKMLDYEATITALANSLALAYDLSGAPVGVPTGGKADKAASPSP